MSSHTHDTSDRVAQERTDDRDTGALPSTVRARKGRTVATVAGGALLAHAIRSRRHRVRAVIQGLVGMALLALGLRGRSRDASGHRTDVNPRGTAEEPDVETATDADVGEVRFTEDQENGPRAEPHLDAEGEEDPRVPDEDDPEVGDEGVSVDLSEAAMADEASEATGPQPEQAYPASEGTDPEPTEPGAPENPSDQSTGADAGTGETETGPSGDDGEDETGTGDTDDTEAGSDSDEDDRDDVGSGTGDT